VKAPLRMAELELDGVAPSLMLSGEEHGVALTLRLRGQPVGFVLLPAEPGATLTPDWLIAEATARLGVQLVEAALATALHAAPAAQPPSQSLTIAICTRNRAQLLERLLRSIDDAHRPAGQPIDLEIIVVDNAPSDDQTRRVVEARAQVTYRCEPCPGLDFARNHALAAARGELIAYLDDDVVVDRGWLAALAGAAAENPDLGCLTGQVLPLACATEAQLLFEARGGFRRGFTKMRWGQEGAGLAPFHPCNAGSFGAGCNMVLKTELLRRLGGFDEALDTGPPLPGGGDLDIFYRVIRAGWPLVYEPAMMVRHEHRRDLQALRRQYWSWGLGFMAFLSKCRQTDPALKARQRHMTRWWMDDQLRQLAKSTLGRHPFPPSFVLAELWGGLCGLAGGYRRSRQHVARLREVHAS
jgi:glycosyltransferase involved in cell wall biosynthesis